MARSMASAKNGMTWKIAMIVTTVLLTVEAPPIAAPKTYFLLVAVLFTSITIVAFSQVAAKQITCRRPLEPISDSGSRPSSPKRMPKLITENRLPLRGPTDETEHRPSR